MTPFSNLERKTHCITLKSVILMQYLLNNSYTQLILACIKRALSDFSNTLCHTNSLTISKISLDNSLVFTICVYFVEICK